VAWDVCQCAAADKLAPGTEGGVTRLLPEDEPMSIYDASVEYAKRGTATGDSGREGVWVGFFARLGRRRGRGCWGSSS